MLRNNITIKINQHKQTITSSINWSIALYVKSLSYNISNIDYNLYATIDIIVIVVFQIILSTRNKTNK